MNFIVNDEIHLASQDLLYISTGFTLRRYIIITEVKLKRKEKHFIFGRRNKNEM